MKDLDDAISYIAKVWKCDEHRYPALQGMTEDERLAFVVKHSLLHINKTTGKLAALLEEYDHSQTGIHKDSEELKVLATKLFINSLKLAQEAGMSGEELLKKSPDYLQ